MYVLKTLCLFSIWAGQSLRKYVLSRRAATDWTAAHVVSMAAFSCVFNVSLHHKSHVLCITNSIILGLSFQTKKKRKFLSDFRRYEVCFFMYSIVTIFFITVSAYSKPIHVWEISNLEWLLVNAVHPSLDSKLQNTGFTHLKMLCLLYTRNEPSLIWDFSLRVYNHIPWWEKLQTST